MFIHNSMYVHKMKYYIGTFSSLNLIDLLSFMVLLMQDVYIGG